MKKMISRTLLSTAVASLLFVGGVTAVDAAYALSSEVKDATPALISATDIGLRVYENKDLQKLPNKDAIVVMSFGTTFKDTRAKTITAVVDQIKAAHPGVKVVTAFTSHIIIDRIKAKEGITYPTPEEALTALEKEGYTRVALVSLDMIPGIEYQYKSNTYDMYKRHFKKMTFGLPAMYWQGQEDQTDDLITFVEAMKSQFPKVGKHQAILLMAHGTPSIANAYYAAIQDRIDDLGWNHVKLYTVEGWPSLEKVIPVLKKEGYTEVTLMPMMMVAGDHATNDMAGDEPDSHKNILINEDFKVNTYIRGLGENKDIQKIFVNRADEAWKALQDDQAKAKKHEKHEKAE